MSGIGKHKRRPLTAVEHRERAKRYRRQAIEYLDDSQTREDLMLSAIKHETIAEELARREAAEH